MEDIRIETGSPEDLEPFLDLLERTASWLRERGIHQWPAGSLRAQAEALAGCARSGHLVVARSGQELAGGCTLAPHADPEWAGHAGPALYLHKLVVARPHAGQGLGRLILSWCEEHARASGVPRLRLDCWDGNTTLRSLYRGCGFRELEAVPSDGHSVRLFERVVS